MFTYDAVKRNKEKQSSDFTPEQMRKRNKEQEASKAPAAIPVIQYAKKNVIQMQYLDSGKLRNNMGMNGAGGEAHHIIPGNVVESMNLDSDGEFKDVFNGAWNGVLLNAVPWDFTKPVIAHRNNRWGHPVYDRKVTTFINQNQNVGFDVIADYIRTVIVHSGADCLDNI